ncbi:uncharacterized protein PgNI_11509 [Pyricularia grisea]|uniref:Uncharacterized protein n=1 Tax=Pyricularia grisea TaxID=148305 RepID=A0A6P8AND5_PYRGI|nr:uncharacterized protein PgNI_11509 [Pyricularia grisea]TLD03548.1 hypothetical protein PgNI_11509 [Pyricularia grisea]
MLTHDALDQIKNAMVISNTRHWLVVPVNTGFQLGIECGIGAFEVICVDILAMVAAQAQYIE